LLVIVGMVILWYGLVPMVGALVKRYQWFDFRNRFNGLRLHPIMDDKAYWKHCGKNRDENAGVYRFMGEFDSVTDDHVLWVRNEGLLVPVALKGAQTYLLPMQGGETGGQGTDPGEEAPEKIRWERISVLAEGTRVFVGGSLFCNEGRWGFAAARENPLVVIFYDGPDHSLATKAIWAGRHRGEYFNLITPYSLIVGALCLLFIAASFLPRPAFRLTVVVSFVATFIPLFPLMPPGLLFTVAYRRLTWRSRILRAYSDLAKLPLHYFAADGDEPPQGRKTLPDGELYGFTYSSELPPEVRDGKIPLLIPEMELRPGDSWYIFGAMRPSELLPFRPKDPFATFGVLPGNPKAFARRCTAKAYVLETLAWILLVSGIALNIFFLSMVIPMLG